MAKSAGGGGRGAGGGRAAVAPSGPTITIVDGQVRSNSEAILAGAPISLNTPEAKASVFSLEKMLRPHVDQYGRIPNAERYNAVRIVTVDGAVRSHGKLMDARYGGKDAATGERIAAGTPVYYSAGRIVRANRAGTTQYLK